MRHRTETPDIETRLSDLLGRDVQPDEVLTFIAIVAFDSSDLEAAFLASRNHTLLMGALLLVVGGTAIYFLFVLAGSRSAHTALRNMQSYTKNVIESMASGLVSLDAAGRVVTVNPRARELLRLGDSDVDGAKLSDLITLEPGSVDASVGAVARGERDVFESEGELVVEGEELPVSLSASSLREEGGKRTGSVILFRDLREVRELQAEVDRARHLAAIGRLAAGVAHEIRNPLSSLKGFAQFLRSRFQSGSDEERYSDIMIEEVERLDRVVQELLDFAKPVRPERRATAPHSLVEDALALVSEDAGFQGVSIERRLSSELPDVLVDQHQIKQALLNVLLNAIEAMGGGGTLTISAALVREGEGDPMVGISISDTGPGMRPDELDRLFEPFYTTKQEGTGLGLTIVSRLVEQNGGRVSVESSPGIGTTFSIRLPVAVEAEGGEDA
ncbi:MAG: PAS domain-containing protein, partial [Candidatus Eisenbacteria bacterium]|nr:PAS domain-containing protein [Candidatus Eisenbacteria bacterium]